VSTLPKNFFANFRFFLQDTIKKLRFGDPQIFLGSAAPSPEKITFMLDTNSEVLAFPGKFPYGTGDLTDVY